MGRGTLLLSGSALAALAIAGCTRGPGTSLTTSAPFRLELPPGAPAPPIPADNPLTAVSVQLGKELFFDARLSLGRGISCASCHRPDHAFSDTMALSKGVGGRTAPRNAPSLINVAYEPLLQWDGAAPTLEQQVLVPLMDSLEMDADMSKVIELLKRDKGYQAQSKAAYGRPMDAFVLTRALASYERTLIGGTSRFDRFLYQGDSNALDPQELRGRAVFNGRGKCTVCHSGHDLSDHAFHDVGLSMDHAADPGRQRITLHPSDRGKFKTPSLRNVAITAPYMHDGSLRTLAEVVEHFNNGGMPDANKGTRMKPLHLSNREQEDLVAFLRSLTDERPATLSQ